MTAGSTNGKEAEVFDSEPVSGFETAVESEAVEVIWEGEPVSPPQVDWKDRYLRLAADFDNYKKREERESKQLRRRVESQLLGRWLEVVDTTDAALAAAEGREDPFFDGLRGIARQMHALLKGAKLNQMSVDGVVFDPRLHEALATMPVDTARNDTVIHVERAGYVYEDGEVLRPARVVVGKAGC
ncbi:MAG: nucleotide exchange factor GrpE [Deltaproteobacteria bacterium CG2_30_63_29]|nr:MAG: nucleotide exchange factor GrpE [Deltaproteobacteria bacterium CG2_30_63_29]PJB37026.1 MAG: nucleotide exchange factor GrpE [Deltaproteobacteria bacterium CG_4_9_14_3_um_filter_63_12]